MKKFKALLVFMLCALCLTGCVRFNTTVTVKRNGKLDVSMLYAMVDMSDYGYDTAQIAAEQKQEYIDKGWDVEDYNQDGFSGFVVSKKNISASELSSSMEDTQSELTQTGDSIRFTKEGFKYILDWKVFNEDQGDQINSYKSIFAMSGGYMKLTVNLPVKPTDSNATTVSNDGKTLEWDLLNLGPDQTIHVEFSLFNIWVIVLAFMAIFSVIVIIIVAAVIIKDRKRDKQRETYNRI